MPVSPHPLRPLPQPLLHLVLSFAHPSSLPNHARAASPLLHRLVSHKSTPPPASSFPHSRPNTRVDYSLFESPALADYPLLPPSPITPTPPASAFLVSLVEDGKYSAAEDARRELLEMGVRVEPHEAYAGIAEHRLCADGDTQAFLTWLAHTPACPVRAAKFFTHLPPTHLSSIARFAELAGADELLAGRIIAHLARFGPPLAVAEWLMRMEETGDAAWGRLRGIFLRQLALSGRPATAADLLATLRQRDAGRWTPSRHTYTLIVQECLKTKTSEPLPMVLQLFVEDYPTASAEFLTSPSIGPTAAPADHILAAEREIQHLASSGQRTLARLRARQLLRTSSHLPSPETLLSLLGVLARLPPPRRSSALNTLSRRLLSPPHHPRPARSLWALVQMLHALRRRAPTPEDRRAAALEALQTFTSTFQLIGVPPHRIADELGPAAPRPELGTDLFWPTSEALGACYAALIQARSDHRDRHELLWREFLELSSPPSPSLSAASALPFALPPVMRPDAQTALPFLHAFARSSGPNRLERALNELRQHACVDARTLGTGVLMRAFAARGNTRALVDLLERGAEGQRYEEWEDELREVAERYGRWSTAEMLRRRADRMRPAREESGEEPVVHELQTVMG